jgi:hypothetical protein
MAMNILNSKKNFANLMVILMWVMFLVTLTGNILGSSICLWTGFIGELILVLLVLGCFCDFLEGL